MIEFIQDDDKWFFVREDKPNELQEVKGVIENKALNDVIKYDDKNINSLNYHLAFITNNLNKALSKHEKGLNDVIYYEWQELYMEYLIRCKENEMRLEL